VIWNKGNHKTSLEIKAITKHHLKLRQSQNIDDNTIWYFYNYQRHPKTEKINLLRLTKQKNDNEGKEVL
jgi:hypothetical protein